MGQCGKGKGFEEGRVLSKGLKVRRQERLVAVGPGPIGCAEAQPR
jgi:hypothetical protein